MAPTGRVDTATSFCVSARSCFFTVISFSFSGMMSLQVARYSARIQLTRASHCNTYLHMRQPCSQRAGTHHMPTLPYGARWCYKTGARGNLRT